MSIPVDGLCLVSDNFPCRGFMITRNLEIEGLVETMASGDALLAGAVACGHRVRVLMVDWLHRNVIGGGNIGQ